MPTDEEDFTATVQRHRSELQRHCVRLLGSHDDAEDALQEALLRAWRARRTQHSGSARGWLYAIATNVCFDVMSRRAPTSDLNEHETAAPSEQEPEARVCERETVELALLTAIQHLSPLQQESFVLRDVLSWSAADTATALSTSLPATNSALQRARRRLRAHLAHGRLEWSCADPCAAQRHTLHRYLSALDAPDIEAARFRFGVLTARL